MNVAQLLVETARRPGSKKLIIQHDGTGITAAQLHEQVMQTASYFAEKGIGFGDRVLVFVPLSINLYRIILALFWLGSVPVFVDEWASIRRLRASCKLADCKAFVGGFLVQCLSCLLPEVRKIAIRLSTKLPPAKYKSVPIATIPNKHPALITFTTGSTGLPKAALRSHGFLLAQYQAIVAVTQPTGNEVDLCNLPILILVNLGQGITTVIPSFGNRAMRRMNASRLHQLIMQQQITRLTVSPYLLEKLLEKKVPMPSVAQIFTGGGPVFRRQAQQVIQNLPKVHCTVVYGATEAEPICLIDAKELASANSEHGLCVGTPYAAIELYIFPIAEGPIAELTDNELILQALPEGQIGEIIVAGDHVLDTYFNSQYVVRYQKIKTETHLWHRTGDAGYLRDGKVYLMGRCHDRFWYDGKWIYPFQTEMALHQAFGCRGTLVLNKSKLLLVVERDMVSLIDLKQWSYAQFGLTIPIVELKHIPTDARHHTKIDRQELMHRLHFG